MVLDIPYNDYVRNSCSISESWKHPLYSPYENSINPCFYTFVTGAGFTFFIIPLLYQLLKLLFFNKFGPFPIKYSFGSCFSIRSVGILQLFKLNLVLIQIILTILNLSFNFTSIHDTIALSIIINFGVLTFLVLPLHVIEPTRAIFARASTLCFWIFSIVASVIALVQDSLSTHKIYVSGSNSSEASLSYTIEVLLLVNSCCIFALHSVFYTPSRELVEYYELNDWNISSERNVLSRFLFFYLKDTIKVAKETNDVKIEDLPAFTIEMRNDVAYNDFLNEWTKASFRAQQKTEKAKAKAKGTKVKVVKPSLFWVILKTTFGFFFRCSFFDFLEFAGQIGQPYLLKSFLIFINNRHETKTEKTQQQPIIIGISIATAIYLLSVIRYISFNRFFINSQSMGFVVENALSTHIYEKGMKLSPKSRKNKSVGELVNNMAQDIQEICDAPTLVLSLISQPIRFCIYLLTLYKLIGVGAIAGLVVALILIPCASFSFTFLTKRMKLVMKFKDQRSKFTSELLNSMKSIKLYSWESPMMERLFGIRNDNELNALKSMAIFNAVIDFIWSTIPFFVACASFAGTALIGKNVLTPEVVFPALSLFSLLTEPMLALPQIFSTLAQTKVSLNRLVNLFMMEEIENSVINRTNDKINKDDVSIDIKNATFTWTSKKDQNVTSDEENAIEQELNPIALKDIDFTARKGQLTCIVGRVGSGKTTLLKAMLGIIPVDTEAGNPIINVNGSIAYCAQNPWILNTSVKENIVFGRNYNKAFYEEVISACQLTSDFELLPDGDETIVGEKGISLSGGQKARISLARAVYSKADNYILDDILSAVDTHVGKKIIKNVLGREGLLSTKTIVLATNSVPVLHDCHSIVLLSSGEIIERGNFEEVMSKDTELGKIIKEFGNKESSSSLDNNEDTIDDDKKTKSSSTSVNTTQETGSSTDEETPKAYAPDPDGDEVNELVPVVTNTTIGAPSFVSFGHNYANDFELDPNSVKKTQEKDEIEKRGKVNMNIYWEYFKACNYKYVTFYIALAIMAVCGLIFNTYVLKYWSEENIEYGYNVKIAFYLILYVTIGIFSALVTFLSVFVIWIFCSINASKYFHDKMAKAVLRSPMEFFETTPIGRILNRFTDDISIIDQHIIWVFLLLVDFSLRAVSVFAIVVYNLPAVAIILIVLVYFYDYFRRNFIPASRELKRLRSATKSPVFSHLQESISGIDTISAYGQRERFSFKHANNLDKSITAYFNNLGCNRWLSMRLQGLSAIIVYASTLSVLASTVSGSALSPGLVGLIMTYILDVTSTINAIIRQYAEVETRSVTLERLNEYCNLKPEAEMIVEDNRPPESWPEHGAIKFVDYETKYRENLDPVLRDVNADINPGEKIGIVGRTGAGKSTLTLALFRIIEATKGHIEIDGLDTSKMGLFDVRSHLNIIPQDSHAFDGTVRQNLDPFDKHSDEKIWKVLELSHLKEHVENMKTEAVKDNDDDDDDDDDDNSPDDQTPQEVATGLQARVTEGGGNLSAGQKQLLCLARALLNSSQILILDEATASVDVQTDKIVQETIRSEFKEKTILTIAHRIDTILDSDRIMVLEKGAIKEFAPPQELLKDTSTIFYELCKQGGHI